MQIERIEMSDERMMSVLDFDYELPEELIAQDPLEHRSDSRLMVLDKESGEVEHSHFYDIKNYLEPGDCLVINNTKVLPARLIGEKEGTGGKVEVLLLRRKTDDVWETLVKPGKNARIGQKLSFGGGLLTAEVVDIVDEGEFNGESYAYVRCYVEAFVPPISRGRLDYDKYHLFEDSITEVIKQEAQSGTSEIYSIDEDSVLSSDIDETSNASNSYFLFIKSFVVNIFNIEE